ncbi:hypothetical protein ASPVEDRAFT_82707 [Aspergillus versicolor CBS 583.65]|uniref:Zn(2)-C6 fungal-type domain-containing protein n=1 Tax=Aspergillus versicolor CBS 583.65 TaxID=1036611 RepID=A0A1L9PI23_ASPVE|nr:uncharacterized protein ASPVEDRAFT_82707 [Aspergillus versicolor CBS 583.65]OJJ01169.1 hypothetical protein ASPVEDRAFT_82707 [Aspergillus versicolor CBS 583.65]
MFLCEYCSRGYQSRSSLARHVRNHSIHRSRHICPTCDVAFSRRDLLMRHMRIHCASPTATAAGSPQESRPKASSRRRVHTACQACRAARVKCNGEQPCDTCALNQRDCSYTSRSDRVSRTSIAGPVVAVAPPTPSTGPEQTSGPLEDLPDCGTDTDAMALGTADPQAMLDLGDLGAMCDLGLSWTSSSFAEPVSWPWMHESLYLQGSPCEDWFAAPTTTAISNQSGLMASTSSDDGHAAEPVIECPPGDFTRTVTPMLPHNQGNQGTVVPRSHSEAQTRVVQELVAYATRTELEMTQSRLCYWRSMSLRITEAFQIGDWQMPDADSMLAGLMRLYERNFSPLWPLLRAQDYDAATLHPLLFLVLASIGAMYGTPQESRFGTALHEEIRLALVTPLFNVEEMEQGLLALAQARLLAQVAALYFGQRRAFSYAQHLGAVLIAQARRMDLFTVSRAHSSTADASKEEQLNAWCVLEARKRLAFGILRADVYASVLMNSRPLLSPEEIEFDLPAPDELWIAADNPSVDKFLTGIRSHAPRARLSFCDLVRIAFDRSEALLEMEPARYELLLFGLQEPVWRFSHDPHLFRRLTGSLQLPGITPDQQPTAGSSLQTDQLGAVHHRMDDLNEERLRLIEALRKWERSFTAVRTTQQPSETAKSRTSIMSSLLLFRLSFLRLTTPLADLHSISQAVSNNQTVDNRRLHQLTVWAQSQDARVAVDFACQIWTLLAQETERPVIERAKHNLLAFSGLHHATVVLWAFAGSHERPLPELNLPGLGDVGVSIPICRSESAPLLKQILHLYRLLAPVGWCSFAAAAERLLGHQFPGIDQI